MSRVFLLRKLLTPEFYFPPTTSAHRGQSVSEDSAVYFQHRGHFSLVVGTTITLYEDSSRISPPVRKTQSISNKPFNLYHFPNWLNRCSFPKLSRPRLGKAGQVLPRYINCQDNGKKWRKPNNERCCGTKLADFYPSHWVLYLFRWSRLSNSGI